MPALISRSDDQFRSLRRISLGETNKDKQEKWFQELMFTQPALFPIEQIEPGAAKFIPICRELTIPKTGGISVFLDIFGLTNEGKLVLIECKLWRNPQARREVIAQALEYASLLRRWSYSDLSIRLQGQLDTKAPNALYEAYRAAGGTLTEEMLHDRVARGLKTGDFIVAIAGDGIREDVHAIADHLNMNSGMATHLALVEFQVWEGDAGETIIIPHVPVRTEVLTHRVYLGKDDQPLTIEAESDQEAHTNTVIDPEGERRREADAAFWQAFCDAVSFDHPEQPPARRGGYGWAKLPMPEPVDRIAAYRTAKGTAGFFFRFKGDEGQIIYDELSAARPKLEAEIGATINEQDRKDDPFEIMIDIAYPGDPFDDDAYLAWLVEYANRVVSALRPFLSQFS